MSRPSLPPPPSVDEIADLARFLAGEAPALLPAFVWCVCRSTRLVRAFQQAKQPSGAYLAMLHECHPTAARLISSSVAGAEWRRKWRLTSATLDELLPEIVLGDPDDGLQP